MENFVCVAKTELADPRSFFSECRPQTSRLKASNARPARSAAGSSCSAARASRASSESAAYTGAKAARARQRQRHSCGSRSSAHDRMDWGSRDDQSSLELPREAYRLASSSAAPIDGELRARNARRHVRPLRSKVRPFVPREARVATAHPAFQILVMWRSLSPSNSMT